ncbi:MAG: hypothetical protein VYC34_09340 [Planctomycetota bacterium]|nr:hypothetical protein [Planctomycetota bacterium]
MASRTSIGEAPRDGAYRGVMEGVFLSQAGGAEAAPYARALIWVGVLLIVALVAGGGLMWLRRRIFRGDSGGAGAPFLLEDLRNMRGGEGLSAEEYEALRRAVVREASGGDGGEKSSGGGSASASDEGLRARPGYDLTGAPLPQPPDTGEERSGT